MATRSPEALAKANRRRARAERRRAATPKATPAQSPPKAPARRARTHRLPVQARRRPHRPHPRLQPHRPAQIPVRSKRRSRRVGSSILAARTRLELEPTPLTYFFFGTFL